MRPSALFITTSLIRQISFNSWESVYKRRGTFDSSTAQSRAASMAAVSIADFRELERISADSFFLGLR
jgi:hypothetical protein